MSDSSSPNAFPGLLEYFEQVSAFSDVAFWLADPHAPAILFMSRAYERIWGRSVDELQTTPRAYQESIHPEDRSIVAGSRTALLEGRTVDIEYRVVRPDGELRWVRTRGVPIRDASGRVHRTAGVNEDITPMRGALEAERAFTQALNEAIVAGIVAIDVRGTQTYVNGAFCRMVGWSEAELVGRSPPFPYWSPEALPSIRDAFEATVHGRVPRGGFSLRFMRKSGERFDVQLLLAPLKDARDAITGWVASVHDITELKRTEEDLRRSQILLQEAQRLAHLGSWEWDIPANRVAWSDELYRIYGLDASTVPASYEAYLEVIHPEDKARVSGVIEAALRNRTAFGFEHRILRGQEEQRYLLAQGDVLCDESGNPVRMVGTALDITERKLADEASFKLQQERAARVLAEQALQTRDDFLSVAAHELRTPLTSLKLQVEVLRRAETAPGTSTLGGRLDRLERQVSRMDRLVNTLLDVSRSLAGRMAIDLERFELRELVTEVVERQMPVAERAGCAVHLQGCDSGSAAQEPLLGEWDRLRLEQAVENLFLNAIKYGAGKPVRVEVSRHETGARLVVRDEGIGIAPEDQARIFERFERAVSVKNFGGFGLGLWIARQVVEAHGGAIRVDSRLGEGATFTVDLPFEHVGPPAAL